MKIAVTKMMPESLDMNTSFVVFSGQWHNFTPEHTAKVMYLITEALLHSMVYLSHSSNSSHTHPHTH